MNMMMMTTMIVHRRRYAPAAVSVSASASALVFYGLAGLLSMVSHNTITVVHGIPSTDFNFETSMPRGNVLGLEMKSRIILPYGPDLFPNGQPRPADMPVTQPYDGYSPGMGAVEDMMYDYTSHYMYTMSTEGYIIVTDYMDASNPRLTEYGFELPDNKLGGIEICPLQGVLLVAQEELGRVDIYNLVGRDDGVTTEDKQASKFHRPGQPPRLLKSLIAHGPSLYDTTEEETRQRRERRQNRHRRDRRSRRRKLDENDEDEEDEVFVFIDKVLPSVDCSTIAVSNPNEGEDLAQGGITVFSDALSGIDPSQTEPIKTTAKNTTSESYIALDFDEWDDEYLLRRGLNMPLTKNALEYWDDYSDDADDLDFSFVRENYRSAIFLAPKQLSWNGPEETELVVNMQDNNGMVRINMTDLSPVSVAGYGLKDHNQIPIDVYGDDETCNLTTYESLFATRNPDVIRTVRYNNKRYIITANEDAAGSYGDWDEDFGSNKIFKGDEFRLKGMTVPKFLFDPSNPMARNSHSAPFNDVCGKLEELYPELDQPVDGTTIDVDSNFVGWLNNADQPDAAEETQSPYYDGHCMEVDLLTGSNAIDYESDPSNPIFYRMLIAGGRGWSIYELSDDPDDLLKLVYDSGDAVEQDSCDAFPWAHNARISEEDAPMTGGNNTYFLTLEEGSKDYEDLVEKNDPEEKGCSDQGDGTPGSCPLPYKVDTQSDKNGPQIENVIVGQACGRLLTAVASERGSNALLFDITDITSPDLIQVLNLSPANQFLSLGLAYNRGVIGEIDPESGVFLSAEQSPTGRAAIMWGGVHSGTVSFWEIQCKEYPEESSDN